MMRDLRNEICEKYPAAAEKAKTSRAAAVKLFCIECMGGCSREAKKCPVKECFLWLHAFRRGKDGAMAEEVDAEGAESEDHED